MKEVTPLPAVIVGDTEDVFALACSCDESFFLKHSIGFNTVLRKLRAAYSFLDNSSCEAHHIESSRRNKNYALEELEELETMFEFCQNNGYRLEKP